MFFTGFTRFSSDVQKANASNKADKVNQLKEMLRFSNELEQKSWLLPHTQEELEIAINRGMEDVKAGRIVSHEDVLKYYMKCQILFGLNRLCKR